MHSWLGDDNTSERRQVFTLGFMFVTLPLFGGMSVSSVPLGLLIAVPCLPLGLIYMRMAAIPSPTVDASAGTFTFHRDGRFGWFIPDRAYSIALREISSVNVGHIGGGLLRPGWTLVITPMPGSGPSKRIRIVGGALSPAQVQAELEAHGVVVGP